MGKTEDFFWVWPSLSKDNVTGGWWKIQCCNELTFSFLIVSLPSQNILSPVGWLWIIWGWNCYNGVRFLARAYYFKKIIPIRRSRFSKTFSQKEKQNGNKQQTARTKGRVPNCSAMLISIVETKPLNLFWGKHLRQKLILLSLMYHILQLNN